MKRFILAGCVALALAGAAMADEGFTGVGTIVDPPGVFNGSTGRMAGGGHFTVWLTNQYGHNVWKAATGSPTVLDDGSVMVPFVITKVIKTADPGFSTGFLVVPLSGPIQVWANIDPTFSVEIFDVVQ